MTLGFHHKGVTHARRLVIAKSVMNIGKKIFIDHQELTINIVAHRMK
jgi:hypothetical protein